MARAPSLIAREDTLLGVCQAIGEDFGFNPLLLRIAFAAVLFWSPIGAFAGYAVLGAVVAFSRWAAPVPTPAGTEDAADCADEGCEDLRLAA
jgi:phage shock protein C